MWQMKQLIVVLLLTVFTILSSHFLKKISYQDKIIKKLDSTINELRLKCLDHDKKTYVSGSVSRRAESPKDLFNDSVVIYNRVPKTASTSLMGLAYDLCKQNKFYVLHINTTRNVHVMSLTDQRRFIENVTTWEDKKPALYHGHFAFLNFQRFGSTQRPIYINVIRKPLDRLVSYYYFLRYGDNFRPHAIRKKKGNTMTFDDCVKQEEKDCSPENMWLQIPFFCGLHVDCWQPGNEWALVQAKQNLVEHYLLVGVTEELKDFVAVLEAIIPRFFLGATQQFREGKKSHLRKTYNKVNPIPETIQKIRSSNIWRMENEFYEFALKQFHSIKKKTLTGKKWNSSGQRTEVFL
ncbi:heparan sulfate 2-O-sulfotransferase 1-like [Tachypleus tridentatus]|uniref:heparan sulfate 2-O-sulfotransferase 1-like n=1 Tax=Tachypleus tridentatus TaxID=6853 RepID=UPI003FD59F25